MQHPVIAEWIKDPRFSVLPEEVKAQKVDSFFEKRLVNDKFRALPEEEQAARRERFITSQLGGYNSPKSAGADRSYAPHLDLTPDEKINAAVAQYNRNNPDKQITADDIPDRSGILGGASELGHGLLNAVRDQFPEDMARIYQGDDVKLHDGSWSQQWIDEQNKDRASRIPSRQVILGDKLNKSLYEGPASVATSTAVGVGGSAIGATAGSVVPGVGTTVGAMVGAGGATGPVFYRLAKNQFLHEVLDTAKKNNVELSEPEWESIKKDIDDEATEVGLWEAGPEAISQFFTAGLIKGVGGKLVSNIPGLSKITDSVSKNTLARVSAKVAAELGEEEVTEYATYQGQEGIRKDVGLRKTDPTLKEFADTQAGPVAVGSLIQLGGHKAGHAALDYSRSAFKIPHDKPTDLMSEPTIEEAKPAQALDLSKFEEAPETFGQKEGKFTTHPDYDPLEVEWAERQKAKRQQENFVSDRGGPRGFAPETGTPERFKPAPDLEQKINTEMAMRNGWRPEQFGGPESLSPEVNEHLAPAPFNESNPLDSMEWKPNDVDIAAHEAATSPLNDLQEPSQAQKEAGNYKKGHTRLLGMDIAFENPSGSERSGTDESGNPWSIQMQHHYGYLKGTEGKDGDHLDLFIKDGVDAKEAETKPFFVVDQINKDGSFDEHKILSGFDNEQEARDGYLSNYEQGWQGLGAITEMSPEQFKEWVKSGKTKKAISYKKPQQVISIPEGVNVSKNGKPYAKKSVGLVVSNLIKKGKNVEPVQLDEEGKQWGWKEFQDNGPVLNEDAQKTIRKKILKAVPDRDYDNMMDHADTLIDDEGFSTDDVYEVINQLDEEKDKEPVAEPEKVEQTPESNPVQLLSDSNKLEEPEKKEPSRDEDNAEIEVPVLAASKSLKPSKRAEVPTIQDLGEKIGGARKDLSSPTGKRGSKAKSDNDSPAWRKRYIVVENLIGKKGWEIFDSRTKRHLVRTNFATQEEAEASLPLAVVAVKHSVRQNRDGQFEIVRNVTDRKRVTLKNGFETRDNAMRYMAKNAVELIETNTVLGEEILVKPDKVYRSGTKHRDGDIKPESFMKDFGFRGVEFGNWNNQDERREILNHAYDGLMDLAEVIGIPPKALSLNGELALAFGARGHGLQGAKAHYEASYGVINLTKMKGAGSLAHEWFHGLDHYLARLDGKASSEMVENKQGNKVFNVKTSLRTFASHGFLYDSKARKELIEAYSDLIKTMASKAEQYVEDTQRAEKFVGSASEHLENELNKIRESIAKERPYGRTKRAATGKELAEFDALVVKLVSGNDLETTLLENKTSNGNRRGSFSYRESNQILDAINNIYKTVTGRSGFNTNRDGILNRVSAQMSRYAARIKMLKEAEKGDPKTKRVLTSYLMEARKLDEGRSSDYWTNPHELAARAFSAYVEDKISEKGNKSDFLSYGANNLRYVLLDVRPFPEGKERVALNKAFDVFFKTIKTKETDKGVMLFSLGDKKTSSSSVSEVQSAISKLETTAINAKRSVVVQSVEDLPQRIQDEFNSSEGDGSLEAAYDGNTAYFVAENIPTSKRAVELWMHEQGVHNGLRGFFSDKELNQFLGQVHLSAAKTAAYKGIMNLYGLDTNKVADRRIAAEEYLAHIGEKIQQGEALNTQEKTIWQKLVALFQKWVNQIGFSKDAPLKYSEIEKIVSDVVSWTVHGPVGENLADSQEPAVAFSQAPTDEQLKAGVLLQEDLDDWRAQLADYQNGQLHPRKTLRVGQTPDILQKLGAKNLPITISQTKLKKILSDKHKIPAEMLYNLPRLLADPVMVFESATMADSLVLMTEISHEGKPVIAALHLNVNEGIEINELSSVYGKDSFNRWVKREVDSGRLRYWNKKKYSEVSRMSGLQLPGAYQLRSRNKIITDKDIVKPVLPGDAVKFSRGQDAILAAESTNPIEEAVEAEQARTVADIIEDVEETRSFATRLFQKRDLGIYLANRETNQLQQKIQRLAGSVRKHEGVFAYSDVKDSAEARLLDQAMLVARDTLAHPEKAAEFKEWAADKLADKSTTNAERTKILKQLTVLDKAMNLTDEQQKFLKGEIEDSFKKVGEKAKEQGIIQELRDNYVRRMWDMPKDKGQISGTSSSHGFKVFTSASKQRTLETVLDGWMAGYELKVNSVSNSYDQIATEIAAIEANKAFIRIGRETVDGEGQPLFTTSRVEGYEPLQASGFSVWTVAGNVKLTLEDKKANFLLETNNYGQKVYLAPPTGNSKSATVFEKKQLLAPAPLAQMINKMTKGDNLFNETPALEGLLRLNAGLKGWILLSSFFHHMAGARSWFFGVNHGWKGGRWNPVKAYKAGLDKIEGLSPLVSRGVKNGLTLGLQQDYDEGLLQQKGMTEKFMEKLGFRLGIKAVEAGRSFREMASNSLFKKFFTGLKAEAFSVEFAHELQKDPSQDHDKVAERVARLINEDFGGLHLQRMGRDPTLQKVSRLLLLAPDWTESNFRAFFGQAPGDKLNGWINKMIGDVPPPPGMQKMYRQFWRRIAVRTVVSTALAQLLINGRDDDDRDDLKEFYRDQFSSWDQFSRMRWTSVDITKLYKILGIDLDAGKRKMFSLAGHFTDPIKLANPAKLIKGKGSPAVRVADSLLTGTDWAQRPFTGTEEFLKTGKTIKKTRFEKTEGDFDRLPAMIVNTVVSMQPIQVGQLLRWWQGEEDGLSALMSAAGAHVSNAWNVDQDKIKYKEHAARMNAAQSLYSTNKNYGAKQEEIEILRTEYKKEIKPRLRLAYKNVQKLIKGLNSKKKFLERLKPTDERNKKIEEINKSITKCYRMFNEVYEKKQMKGY